MQLTQADINIRARLVEDFRKADFNRERYQLITQCRSLGYDDLARDFQTVMETHDL